MYGSDSSSPEDGLNIGTSEQRPNFIQISISEQYISDAFSFGIVKDNRF